MRTHETRVHRKNYIPTENVPRTIPTEWIPRYIPTNSGRRNIPTDIGSSEYTDEHCANRYAETKALHALPIRGAPSKNDFVYSRRLCS
ncbi:hypothetical protein F2Q70_00024774 [Brassica cretica]|uniref:Uncharacterized protein n=1 Tax=Brassica cretica TaxID=69181 RepID=A0A8S9L0Y3_BRACR|nr:hypothetical protein F2Q70_00024774 [Brassica cretica]